MGDGADLALQYAINTELDAPFGELDDHEAQANGPDYFVFAGRVHRIPYPEESAELRRAIQHKRRLDFDF